MSSKKTSKKSSKPKKGNKSKKDKEPKKDKESKKDKKPKKDKESKKDKKDKKISNEENDYSDTEDLEISAYKVDTEVNESITETQDCFDTSDDDSKKVKIVEAKDRITRNFLTKYEAVRIIGERTKQLVMGAKPLISNYSEFSYEQIAVEELKLNMIPFKIRRPVGNNKYEIWNLNELRKDHLQSVID
jgi:DNA-directed RNA polymerase subunit K/omega